jgi:hypothetical protein
MTPHRRRSQRSTSHIRSSLLANEIAVGLALLAIILFHRRPRTLDPAGERDTLANAITVSGTAFLALSLISRAAETALLGVADAGDQSAILTLNHLQGRIPSVWTVTAPTVAWCAVELAMG